MPSTQGPPPTSLPTNEPWQLHLFIESAKRLPQDAFLRTHDLAVPHCVWLGGDGCLSPDRRPVPRPSDSASDGTRRRGTQGGRGTPVLSLPLRPKQPCDRLRYPR